MLLIMTLNINQPTAKAFSEGERLRRDVRSDIHDQEVHDPVRGRRYGRSLLSDVQGEDLGWIDPDSGLKSNGKGALEHEQHCSSANAGRVFTLLAGTSHSKEEELTSKGGLVLYLVDQAGLHNEDTSHHENGAKELFG